MGFQHIISNPEILNGKPILKGTRISVDIVLEWVASGASLADIVQTYPHIEAEALQYAARFLKNEIVIEVKLVA